LPSLLVLVILLLALLFLLLVLVMVKLSPELIEQCASYTNPVRDREVDFRGKCIMV